MWCFSIFYGKNQHKRTDSDRNNGNRNYRRFLWFIPFPYKTSSAATRNRLRGYHHTTTVSKQLNGHPSSAPYIVYQNLETDEIIQCEVHPYVYDCLTTGDTCVLWYSMGNYTYKFRK